MKFSYNWLKELSETKKTPQEVAQNLTLHSFEVENVLPMGKNLEMVKIGEVLARMIRFGMIGKSLGLQTFSSS
jgi:hypothetical protein